MPSRDFPGFANYLSCGDINIKSTPLVTVSAWVWMDAFSGDQSGYLLNYGNELLLHWFRDNLNFRTGGVEIGAGVVVAAGSWHHLVFRQAGTGGSDKQIFRNNAVVATGAGTNMGTSATTTLVGNNQGGAGTFDGRMCDLCVWNAALSNGEIDALYRRVRPLVVRPAAVKAYWPLRGNALPEPDLSGNGKNLAIAVGSVPAHIADPGLGPLVPVYGG
jgi:hypothetical protein